LLAETGAIFAMPDLADYPLVAFGLLWPALVAEQTSIDEQYKWGTPAIDRQGIALILIVVVFALVLGTAALWIGLH
jgi:hypothetical protein